MLPGKSEGRFPVGPFRVFRLEYLHYDETREITGTLGEDFLEGGFGGLASWRVSGGRGPWG